MLKKLLRSVREYKTDSLRTPVFVVLEVVMEVLIPFFMANLIDVGMAGSDMPYILRMGGILAVAALLSLCFGALSGKYAANASAGFAKNLRHDLFYSIQKFSFANINRFSTASLVTRLTTDVTNVQNAYQMVIRILIRGRHQRAPVGFGYTAERGCHGTAKQPALFEHHCREPAMG